MPHLSSLLLNACDEEQALSLEAFKPESEQLHRLIVRGRWAAGMLQCPIFLLGTELSLSSRGRMTLGVEEIF
jgi:hypothetical protein